MSYQELIIDKIDAFELKDIFDCGQCFRWNEEENGSYTGVVKNGVLNVNCDKQHIYFKGNLDCDIKEFVNKYFDMNRCYESIKEKLSKIDEYMENSIKYGKGIRILNQDLWETIISYIISILSKNLQIIQHIFVFFHTFSRGIKQGLFFFI